MMMRPRTDAREARGGKAGRVLPSGGNSRTAGPSQSRSRASPAGGRARGLRCKRYHEPRGRRDPGLRRGTGDWKSRCPGWTLDPALRERLLVEAIEDPDGGADSMGRPKRLWNALAGWYFVGVSTNEAKPAYNCYPEVPATTLLEELVRRAERTVEEFSAV